MSDKKPSMAGLDPLDALASDINGLAVSKLTSFLDLPGEIRNQIYDYCPKDADPSADLSAAINLSHTCRTTRTEYLPLYFDSAIIILRFVLIGRFLKAFYTSTSPFPPLPNCTIFADHIHESNWLYRDSLDIKWLATFLPQWPDFQIYFQDNDRFLRVAVALSDLLTLIATGQGWRTRLADFSAITLLPRPIVYKHAALHGISSRQTEWVLEFVIKPEKITVTNEGLGVRQVVSIVENLELPIKADRWLGQPRLKAIGGGKRWKVRTFIC